MTSILNARCVLVTGATSGIGRSLALAIHNLDTKPTVIVVGRRQERLDELAALGERIQAVHFDVSSGRDAVKQFVEDMVTQHPELDAVIFSAGVQHIFDFKQPESVDLDLLEAEFNTNYLAIATMIKFLMPHFLQLNAKGLPSFIIPVTSELGFLPFFSVPNYCATKAALHSLCMTLQMQLKDTNVHVMEIIPPLTESELHDHQGITPRIMNFWMLLDKFTKECMEKLCRGDEQIPVGGTTQKWERFEKGKMEALVQKPH